MDLAGELWDFFDDDAVIADREAGVWAAPAKVHPVKFEGGFYRSAGHLFQHRSPQGRPVIVQAGQSPTGIDFAARNAEVVFTAQTDLDLAREYYREIKERAAAAGRDPESVRVLPGFTPVTAGSAAAVEALEAELDRYVDIESTLKDAAVQVQADLSDLTSTRRSRRTGCGRRRTCPRTSSAAADTATTTTSCRRGSRCAGSWR